MTSSKGNVLFTCTVHNNIQSVTFQYRAVRPSDSHIYPPYVELYWQYAGGVGPFEKVDLEQPRFQQFVPSLVVPMKPNGQVHVRGEWKLTCPTLPGCTIVIRFKKDLKSSCQLHMENGRTFYSVRHIDLYLDESFRFQQCMVKCKLADTKNEKATLKLVDLPSDCMAKLNETLSEFAPTVGNVLKMVGTSLFG